MNKIEYSAKVTDNYHKSLVNLANAVQNAGGCVSVLDKDMTLQDLLMMCSTNDVIISAKHTKPQKDNANNPALEKDVEKYLR